MKTAADIWFERVGVAFAQNEHLPIPKRSLRWRIASQLRMLREHLALRLAPWLRPEHW